MFTQIKALLDIRKEAPDAVGYNTWGPISFPLPIEITEAIPESISNKISELICLHISIYNYSPKSQRDIRVLYSGDWEFSPKISFDRRETPVKFNINQEDKEIVINELPPNEAISIEVLNPHHDFKIDQVLLGDKQITKLMQKLAEAKRHPTLARLQLITVIALLSILASFSWAIFSLWRTTEEINSQDLEFSKLLGDSGLCKLRIFENKGTINDLAREFISPKQLSLEEALRLNKASSFEELQLKSKIILCDTKADIGGS